MCVLPPSCIVSETSSGPEPTVPVSEVLPEFASVFPFDEFNPMQSATLPAVLGTDENVVVSAPTASGKTAIAEAAIVRTVADGGTALFLAPLRALTNEKEREWERFEALGYSVYVVTGERDLDPRRAEQADVLVMTPEKADSATRKHDSRRYGFVSEVDLCVIDEVHLLDSEQRGSVLEVTISRLRRLCPQLRTVALSATMRNVDDVAAWLDAPGETTFSFDEAYRPVPLEASVATYTHGENPFADKYRRLYRALDLAEPHVRDGGQALVFVASRQDTVRAAETARDELASRDVPVGARGELDWHTETDALANDTLRQSVLDGVGFHHAGLSREDKDRVEAWFRGGRLAVLFSTSTLAWGVNLPARCVVLRDTYHHDPLEGEVEMSHLDVLQMLGRAGRPGYDDTGYAHVICDADDASRYRRLLADGKAIESRRAASDEPPGELAVHLNAEIALGTVGDLDDIVDWLETTFYYVRAQRTDVPDGQLRRRLRSTLAWLTEHGFVERAGSELALEPTPLGRLASEFYLRLETARRFADVATGRVTEPAVLRAVAAAAEFDSASARADETDAIQTVLGDAAAELAPGARKVLAVVRARMGAATPSELKSDAWIIRQNALRLLAAFRAIVDQLGTAADANLVRRLEARLETGVDDDAVGLTAIEGVGAQRAETLAAAGYRSPAEVATVDTETLAAAGITDTVAARLQDNVAELPAIEVEWGAFPDRIGRGERTLREVTVRSTAGSARAGLTVTVNGVEMTAKSSYLGETTLPVGVFGSDTDTLTIAVRVVFPELPLEPVVRTRTVHVEAA